MFKTGVFMQADGDVFAVYQLDEKNMTRFDICREGTSFHSDPDNILYSYYKKGKNEYIFGNRDLAQKYKKIQSDMYILNLPQDTSSDWIEGNFRMTVTCGDSNECFYRIVKVNGMLESEEFVFEGNSIATKVMDGGKAFAEVIPLNIDTYTKINLLEILSVKSDDNACFPLSELRRRYNIKHLELNDFRYASNEEDALALIEEIRSSTSLIGFDTETTGTDVNLYGKNYLTGIIVSTKTDNGFYFPFRQGECKNLPMRILPILMKVLLEKENECVAHFKKFDRKVIYKEGYDYRIGKDSYVVSVLNDPRQRKGLHELKSLEEKRSGLKYLELPEIFVNPSQINFSVIKDPELIKCYACPDAPNAVKNYINELSKLPKSERFILSIEEKIANILADEEYWGFRIDMDVIKKGKENTEFCIDKLEKILFSMLHRTVSLTSGDALGDILYNKMKCPVLARTATDKPSTGNSALTKLSKIKREVVLDIVKENILDKYGNILIKKEDLNSAKYPEIIAILKHKELVKLNTAFYNRVVKQSVASIYEVKKLCYRYFCWINGNGAGTGRQSSPMHQLPKKIKEGILSDSEDHILIDTDYCQVELRMIASLAQEPEFIEMCKDVKVDIHRAIGALISGKQVWEISKEERQSGKRRNFGVVYVISAFGLAQQEFGASPTPEQVKICEKKIAEFFQRFLRIAEFIKKNKIETLKYGKMSTFFGRIRYFPEVFDPNTPKKTLSSIIRQGNNLPVQGTSADLLKMAMIAFDEKVREKGWNALVDTPQGKYPLVRLMLTVHDEMLVSSHKSIPLEEVLEAIQQSMEITIEGFAPFFAESSVSENWEIGHGDSMKIVSGLREKLLDNYHKTGKSEFKFDTCTEIYSEVKRQINKYADESLIAYLEGLLKEHGEDVQTLKDYVRHASLTHEFIERFPQSAEHKKEHGSLTHIERINYAAERYMEFRKTEAFHGPTVVDAEEVETEKEITQDMNELLYGMENLIEIGPDGNPVYEDMSDAEEESMHYYNDDTSDEDIIAENALIQMKKIYVWKFFDTLMLDLQELNKEESVKVLNEVYKDKDEKGFYDVKFIFRNNKVQEAQFKVESVDTDRIQKYIEELVENARHN